MLRFAMLLAAVITLTGATRVGAQTPAAGVPPAPGRLTVSVNGALQASSQDVTRETTFSLYEEDARIGVTQNDIEGGGLFDIGVNYRAGQRWNILRDYVGDKWGVGFAYSFVRSSSDGFVDGSIPHPLVFEQPRSLGATAADLEHKEHGIHFMATYYMPFSDKLDFTFSLGPSFFNISQDLIRQVTFSETPPFDSVTVDGVEVLSLRQNGVGFNLGVDASYTITPMFAAGVMARYTRGGADFELGEGGGSKNIKAGGFQFGGGVRVRLW